MGEDEIEIMIEEILADLPEELSEMDIACVRDELREVYGLDKGD